MSAHQPAANEDADRSGRRIPATRPVRRAATIALLRDGDGAAEVYLLRRAASMAAAAAMHVFPGGGVEPIDGPAEDAGTTLAAAIRELAEETGVELPASPVPVRFARWITPEGLPVRHDTDFFAVALPGDQSPTLIGTEADIGEWCQPTDALADAATGRIGLLPPTWAALQLLAGHADVSATLSALRERNIAHLALMPRRRQEEDGTSRWVLNDVLTGDDITDPTELGLPAGWQPIPPGLDR